MAFYKLRLKKAKPELIPEVSPDKGISWCGGGIVLKNIPEQGKDQWCVYLDNQFLGKISERHQNLYCLSEIAYYKQWQRLKVIRDLHNNCFLALETRLKET